jgi:hypothetical protein
MTEYADVKPFDGDEGFEAVAESLRGCERRCGPNAPKLETREGVESKTRF